MDRTKFRCRLIWNSTDLTFRFTFSSFISLRRLASSVLSSQSGRPWLLQTLFVCVCMCFVAFLSVPLLRLTSRLIYKTDVLLSLALLVCPAVKAYISVTMDWILMKLGESVCTEVRLIV